MRPEKGEEGNSPRRPALARVPAALTLECLGLVDRLRTFKAGMPLAQLIAHTVSLPYSCRYQ